MVYTGSIERGGLYYRVVYKVRQIIKRGGLIGFGMVCRLKEGLVYVGMCKKGGLQGVYNERLPTNWGCLQRNGL